MFEKNTFGILGDNNLRGPVIDVKGRDSRREIDRWDSLLDYYGDRVIYPPLGEWSLH